MLKANLSPRNLTGRGRKYALSCPELELSVTSHTSTNELCRKIMETAPERGAEPLEVYRDGKLSFTIRCIKDWATKTIIESQRGGLQLRQHQPMPKRLCL